MDGGVALFRQPSHKWDKIRIAEGAATWDKSSEGNCAPHSEIRLVKMSSVT
jgi:hypothetical protein